MEFVTLNNGIKMPILGYGVFQISAQECEKNVVDALLDLQTAKQNGITQSEIAEILTHAAFYVGWPKAWAAFRLAKEIWTQ